MTKPTVAAAAFAAGMMIFAAHAQDQMADYPETRAEGAASKCARPVRCETKKARVERTANADAGKLRTDPVYQISVARKEMTGSTGKEDAFARRFGWIVSTYAASYGVPASLAHAVIRVESNFRVDALGRAGEIGLMQIKPATARLMGYDGSEDDLYNPETNIKFGMKYLAKAHKLGGGTTCGTVLKYNAGHGAKRMNSVSAAYCSKVMLYLAGA